MKQLDWDSIRYFLHAARGKSLSAAARTLRVEHTTIGRQLGKLEGELGFALVDRTPSGLSLTRLGRRALRLAEDMDRAARALAELDAGELVNVRLVVPTGFTALLSPFLGQLADTAPGVSLDIVSSAKRLDLRKGRADLAIRIGPIGDPELIARKLGDVGSALYASRGYLARCTGPVDTDDLSGHRVIGFHRSLATLPAAEWLTARSAGATVVMQGREAVDMVAAARSGVGLAVLPCFLADAEASLVRLTPRPIAVRRVSLVYRREARLAPTVRTVIRFIVEVMKQHESQLLP